ncbi:MAG: MBL fold metallo-hydrolase [Planctomyces sp.]|nr:MBL fold metallo-hydrolase [Planctomyces sp.]
MLARRELFPNIIEMNYQFRQRMGCSVYVVHDQGEWALIDIGFEDSTDEIVDAIRQMDFALSQCRYLICTHADVDHIQGMKRAKELLPQAKLVAHPHARKLMEAGDRIETYAEISAQGISIDLGPIPVDASIDEGDILEVGGLKLKVWSTPGHATGQLAFEMGPYLFSGDNIYRDGGVGNIDAHHGSDLVEFIKSLERIRDSKIEWLLPSHGPVFRKQAAHIQKTIDRLKSYLNLADFGTCATGWPLLQEWEEELIHGFDPTKA